MISIDSDADHVDVEDKKYSSTSEAGNGRKMTESNRDEFLHFSPVYSIGAWEDEKWEKKISVAILLPTGTVRNTSDHKVEIVDGGKAIKISLQWPKAMAEPKVLYRSWLPSDDEKKRVEGSVRARAFRPLLLSLRSNTTEPIISTCKIPLPTAVKADIDLTQGERIKAMRFDETGEKILLLTLDAPSTGYDVEETRAVEYEVV